MSYLRPSGRFATVSRGGRRFVVKPPTVATIMLVLATMPEEIAALVKAYQVEEAVGSPQALTVMAETIIHSAGQRIVPVLESFAHLHDGAPWALREELATDPSLCLPLVLAAIGMVDMGQLYRDMRLESLNLDHAQADVTAGLDDNPVSPFDRVLLRVAWKFGQAPHDVMGWPWENFMAATRVLPTLDDGIPVDQAFGDRIEYYEGNPTLEALGVAYSRVAPDNG